MSFQEGEEVNGYTVMEQLGRGGMATVFKAYHASLDRYVALKVMHPAFMEDENFLARFQREARVVAKLEHPNIIPVYDFSDHDGRTYLVMKYVEGMTLKGRLQEGPIPPDEGVKIIETLGAGLAYAHDQGVLHRDIKPSNVILAKDGQIFLADFGLARIASAGESTLSSDMMIGTPQYISPEQALGERDLGPATDIYSFGVVVYELVVGQVPYSSDTPFSVVHDHIYKPLPLPRTVNPNVPESMERILLKSLAKDPADRFESVDVMVTAFKKSVLGDTLPDVEHVASVPTPTPAPIPSVGKGSTGASQPESAVEEKLKKKRKFRWWYIPLILLFCFFTLVILSNNSDDNRPGLFDNGQNGQNNTEVDNSEDESDEVDQSNDGSGQGNGQSGRNAVVKDAENQVAENPDDPYAYLNLAVAYLDAGNDRKAADAYEDGQILAGDDPDFYMVAGDLFASRNMWLQALEQYIQSATYGDLENNEDLFNKLRQSVYKSAEDVDSRSIFIDAEDKDELLVQVGAARYTLLHLENPELALEAIERALDQNPNFPDALLVRAEILIEMGGADNIREATRLLRRLNEGDIPSWIQIKARNLLSEISE